ncbi:FMN dependent dehydrogenase, putative [Talaromyces stipitatus ATCC 10500]|uniref:FMN dependent dehydrogenase, putative n=2 Tax=Talaromyces stipitatus (strain ATCC 10500 / CBS 375.48 / QM 6759 / NRRL 1006) TaxID=441959 RepID=B8MKL5_TALSN|nr:FMN dependent dehydrogenase, putative [Talaromyces stipitatus ATCC 10500]EED15370.1 FMN dependent dehydrogenase, putative [Talaromyces stipitatus ATCC 10500]
MPENYGQYQQTIYSNGMFSSGRPVITTDPRLLEEQARKTMSLQSFGYIAGGAGEKATMDSNRLAFRQWKLIPKMLRTTEVDTSIELFGEKYSHPVLMAPIGVQALAHRDKETGLAEACSEVDVPYILSTASGSSFEDIAASCGDVPKWYQLYWPNDNDITISLLKRAKENGYKALVVTLDTWTLAWRPADLDTGYLPFLAGIGTEFGLTDPVFRAKFEADTGSKVEDEPLGAARAWLQSIFGVNHTWEDVAFLRKNWDGPLILKGIQHVDDARTALKYGCDGIVVSNHGGRQLDGAIGSLEVLPEIVDAVGKDMTVLFDSGIRTGSDIVKAIALGAKAVFVGRPVMYGYGINGKEGAKEVLQGLLADFYLSMAIAGIPSIADCHREVLRKVQYGGDLKASL